MKLLRLQGRKVSDYLLRKGSVWKGKTMMIRWLYGPPASTLRTKGGKPPTPDAHPVLYVGSFASAKLDKSAVRRNRMRRRVREALRVSVQHAQEIPTTQLLISPRSASLTAPYADILSEVSAFLTLLSPTWKPHQKEK